MSPYYIKAVVWNDFDVVITIGDANNAEFSLVVKMSVGDFLAVHNLRMPNG